MKPKLFDLYTDTMPNWILGDRFDTVYPHKGSIKALWETKWKFCVSYPLRVLDKLDLKCPKNTKLTLRQQIEPEIHLSVP